jgi:HprK-related kinase A
VQTRADKHTSRFRIGEIAIALRVPFGWLLNQYTSLYRHFQVGQPAADEILVEVSRRPLSLRHRRRFEVRVNGQLAFEPARRDEVLPCIEWAINCRIVHLMHHFLQLHASSMQVAGMNVMFPAGSGSGKSTLTAGLLARGWKYLSDEFALIHTRTLALHPYPRAICIKRPSYPVIRSLGLRLHENQHYYKGAKGYVGFINPVALGSDVFGSPGPARYVIFPRYTPGAEPALIPISRAEAAFALHEVCFNLLTCDRTGLDVVAGVVRGASCYRLVAGEISRTCNLLEGLVRGTEQPWARSA